VRGRLTFRERLAANQAWHRNQLALVRETQTVDTTKGTQMGLTPAQRAERDDWNRGVDFIKGINRARAQTGEPALEVDLDNAPESVKAERREAKDRAEGARINEQTRALELETARLEGELKARRAA
jgi:hypothetical protein